MKSSTSSIDLSGQPSRTSHPPASETIRTFFDSIAARYDSINHFLSFRLDEFWRRRSRDLLLEGSPRSILDLGTGTGKFLALFLAAQKWDRAAGLDFSGQMLRKAREGLSPEAEFVSADFHDLPFRPAAFDLIISSFTLRSVQDLPRFFSEVHRVLAPQGKAGFLCLTRPGNPFWRALSVPYLKFYLPLAGGLLSGNRDAYRFLASSILNFQEPAKTKIMLEQSGFRKVEIHPFTFGLATLIRACK